MQDPTVVLQVTNMTVGHHSSALEGDQQVQQVGLTNGTVLVGPKLAGYVRLSLDGGPAGQSSPEPVLDTTKHYKITIEEV